MKANYSSNIKWKLHLNLHKSMLRYLYNVCLDTLHMEEHTANHAKNNQIMAQRSAYICTRNFTKNKIKNWFSKFCKK